jgi:hypothetical protein
MKHIKIYEKFESEILSKTMNFLEKKINKETSEKFVKTLGLYLHDIFDYPISYIKDDNIMYLNKKNALNVINTQEKNKYRIDYLKFWFSIDTGLITVTCTGDDILQLKQKSNILNYDLLQRLKNDTGLEKGILEPIIDYSSLNHLDKIVGIFSYSGLDRFTLATLYEDNKSFYAIQNYFPGAEPRYGYDDWQKYGNYSWGLGKIGSINDDHLYLHKYSETDDELSVKYDDEEEKDKNVYKYNLIISPSGHVDKYTKVEDIIKNADFALVISINDLLEDNKKYSNIKGDRIKQKKDALKLLSDDNIKRINIERYTIKLFNKFGITKEKVELKNIEKMISKLCLGKNALFSISMNTYNISKHPLEIKNLIALIDNMIVSDSKMELERSYNNIFNFYKDITSNYNYNYDIINNSLKHIKEIKSEDKEMDKIIGILEEISIYINDYILSKNINTIYDLDNIKYFIMKIYEMVNSDYNLYTKSSNLTNLIKYINSFYDVRYYYRNLEIDSVENKNKIISGLENLFKNIKNL